jgi:hypothetical protein
MTDTQSLASTRNLKFIKATLEDKEQQASR